MQYIIADLKKAIDWGFLELSHLIKGNKICLNEKEVINNQAMSGTLAERAEILGGSVLTATETKQIINTTN